MNFYRGRIFIVEHRRDSNWRHLDSGICWQRIGLIVQRIKVDLQQSGCYQIGDVALRADCHGWEGDLLKADVKSLNYSQ